LNRVRGEGTVGGRCRWPYMLRRLNFSCIGVWDRVGDRDIGLVSSTRLQCVGNIPLNSAVQKDSRTWPTHPPPPHNPKVNHKQLVGRKLNVLSSGEINWNLCYSIHYIPLPSNRSKIFITKPNCMTLCRSHPYNYSPKPILILFISFQYSFRGTTGHARQIKPGSYGCYQRVYHCVVLTNLLNENVTLFDWPYCWHSCFYPLFRPTSRFRSTERSIASDPTSRLGRSDVPAI
jgi:hypothetical protein